MSTSTLDGAPEPSDGTAQTVERGARQMLAAIASLPDQLAQGIAAAGDVGAVFAGRVDRVVLCGMGGSAFPADLLRLHAAELAAASGTPPLEIRVSRDYAADPSAVGPLTARTLVIAASFSGNTEETLTAYDRAREAGAAVVALCAGGRLAAKAAADAVPCIRLMTPSPEFQPRAASGLFLGALGGLLDAAGLLPGSVGALHAAGPALAQVLAREGLRSEVPAETASDPLGLAVVGPVVAALHDRIPVFYAGGLHAEAVARIAKIKINENAKMPAFFAAVPEFNHNEMVGYTRQTGPFVAVFVDDPQASPAMIRRMLVSQRTLAAHGVAVLGLALPEAPSRLVSALAWLYRVDLASVALAVAAGIDPNPVALVESFKRDLVA